MRAGYGTAGRRTRLCVNYFQAQLVRAEDVFHYNVSELHWSVTWALASSTYIAKA